MSSVYDLRAWAAQPAPLALEHGALGLRRALPLGDPVVSVGLAQIAPGAGELPTQPADEFLLVLEGELVLSAQGGAPMHVGADRSAVLPAGTRLTWRAERPTRALFMRHVDFVGAEGPCLIDPSLARAPSAPPLAELLTTPTPSCRNRTQFRSADQSFTCGVWDSTPYARRAMSYAHHELMHLLEGEVTFEDEAAGERATFRAGDVLLVRRGARCSWDSLVPVTKVFAIHRPV